jgi:hypothetical protein
VGLVVAIAALRRLVCYRARLIIFRLATPLTPPIPQAVLFHVVDVRRSLGHAALVTSEGESD